MDRNLSTHVIKIALSNLEHVSTFHRKMLFNVVQLLYRKKTTTTTTTANPSHHFWCDSLTGDLTVRNKIQIITTEVLFSAESPLPLADTVVVITVFGRSQMFTLRAQQLFSPMTDVCCVDKLRD